MSTRRDRNKRRNLNPDEMFSLGFAELQEHSEEDGWAYPDDDDEETTENFTTRENRFSRQRKQ